MTEVGWLVLSTLGAVGGSLVGFDGKTKAGVRAVGLVVMLVNTAGFGWHLCRLLST